MNLKRYFVVIQLRRSLSRNGVIETDNILNAKDVSTIALQST